MSKEELENKYRPLVEASGIFTLRSIEHVNHRPHPFMIGPMHVAYAADHCGGILGDAVLEKIPCAHPGCGKMYHEHTSDCVMFLSLTRHVTDPEARAALQKIVDAGMEADKIDGFAFVETDEKFRVREEEPDEDN